MQLGTAHRACPSTDMTPPFCAHSLVTSSAPSCLRAGIYSLTVCFGETAFLLNNLEVLKIFYPKIFIVMHLC